MAEFRSKFSSANQDWETPAELFAPLDAEFQFTLDAAAADTNAKAPKWFTVEDNALAIPWGAGERVWLNPPYKEVGKWVRKAHEESCRGNLIVMLIAAKTNTNWFHDFILKHAEVRFIRGRPKFVGAKYGLPQPLCIAIFNSLVNGNEVKP